MRKFVGMMEDITDWTLDQAMVIFICLNYKYLQFHQILLYCLSSSYLLSFYTCNEWVFNLNH